MGLRVRKSFKLTKGVRLNLSKSGMSISAGVPGFRKTVNTKGRVTSSIGIPGTGVSYVKTSSLKSNKKSSAKSNSKSNGFTSAQQSGATAEYSEKAASIVKQYDELLILLKSTHKMSDPPVNWQYLSQLKPPFESGTMGKNEMAARSDLKNYNPSILEKLSKKAVEAKKQELNEAIQEAINKDKSEYEQWEYVKSVAAKVLTGDIDAYYSVIDELNPLDDLLEFGSDFEFGTDNKNVIEVEFKVKSDEIIPEFSMSLDKKGELARKPLTKTAHFDLVQDYVSSCCLRIARDMFALLPVEFVIVHAVDTVLSTQTGNMEEETILSISFDREKMNTINFENVDPSDCLDNFSYNMKFLKTKGFSKVKRINE
ncbi:MAG: DUF4236 domain-containing protein [Clostridia bacterium]